MNRSLGLCLVSLLKSSLCRLFVCSLCFPAPLWSQQLAIGVPQLMLQRSIQSSDSPELSPYAHVLRSVAAPPFLSLSEEGTLAIGKRELSPTDVGDFGQIKTISFGGGERELRASDGERLEYTTVVFRDDVAFVNGQQLTPRDVRFSLATCLKRDELHRDLNTSKPPVSLGAIDSSSSGSVVARVYGGVSQILKLLGTCPAFQARSGEIFSSLLGTSNFFVGLGAYEIALMKPGVRLGLKKVRERGNLSQAIRNRVGVADEIELREISEARRALTALRYGSIDLFFSSDPEVRYLARTDETLEVVSCRGYQVIYRKGLELNCEDEQWVARLRYVG